MDNLKKEEKIYERFDLDDKKEEPLNEIIKTNRKKRIKPIFISLSILVVIGFAFFLVLFFIKNENETKNKESVPIKGIYENKKDIEAASIEKEKKEEKEEEKKLENKILCNIGKNELCLTCEKEKCGSCNPGYKLKDGKCIFIYSFKATYESTKTINLHIYSV